MRLPKHIIPLLVITALCLGYTLRTRLIRPTTTQTFAEGAGTEATFVVDGVRCRGTAMFFSSLYKDEPGILGIQTFAGEHTAVFRYDPKRVTLEQIKAVMETPIPFDDGTTVQVFRCVSIKR